MSECSNCEKFRTERENAHRHMAAIIIGIAELVRLGQVTKETALAVLRVPEANFDTALARVEAAANG